MCKEKAPYVAIVDDDREGASILADFLMRQGSRVQTFDSAERVRNCDLQHFDSIILDIHLPGIWGSEYGFMLRQTGYEGPIIAVSGDIENWDKDDLRDLGFTYALGKPLDTKELAECLKSHLQLRG